MTDTVAVPEGADMSENFAALLEESFENNSSLQHTVVKGTVVAVESDFVLIDVGLKSEGRVPIKEFAPPGQPAELAVGDKVEVYVERYEDINGEVVLSREKARREEAWEKLEEAFEQTERVSGTIFGRVKGGFTVDLSGAVAFLPGSQVDIRPVRDVSPLMGTPQPFMILKMDRARGNIVVSRRAVLEETRAAERTELVANLKEGQVLQGVVKNITDYGAFVDLGGVDGLLHVTDISWRRINHPSEALQVGQTVQVQVVRFNPETQRISLGMKQLEADPWDDVELKYPVSVRFTGRVTNITDYGAFVELEPGIEGLVHVSEMSWTKKNVHPGKIVSTSQEVEVQVLDVDPQKRRISLGLKQTQENPWDEFAVRFPGGTEIDGEVRNITEFGLFVGLPGDIDGMVHLSDISWEKTGEEALEDFTKGDMVKVKILEVDTDKERISLGIKQLSSDPFAESLGNIRKGEVVTATVSEVNDGGIEVKTSGGLVAFIRRSDLSRDRSEQRPDRFAVGEKVDAKVTNIDPSSRRISMSIKANEIAEEKTALAQFGSSDSGASLGDILGAAIRDKQQETQEMIGDTPAPEAAAEAPAEEEATEEAPAEEAAAEAPAEEEAAEEAPAEEAAAEAPAEEAKEEDGAEKS
ncbi:MAG: 30S ribosomal protein S1 [Rhodospirillaceae bacterium]|jgi:small subunit ribosomal protein S1|nr:30S ribosomal protein S1 [Rhodospirillaceae bacterium]MBT5771070.1 30S ribosomal protein S1 [Rhodospirillaceae bacterium]MBT6309127.1 30S ribosomal protein S1 [Rhodospirillaceae bacterium]MBT7365933.1 30S ribosomal protein S1 [Rhodospirillaceae bacterium]